MIHASVPDPISPGPFGLICGGLCTCEEWRTVPSPVDEVGHKWALGSSTQSGQ